MSGLPAGAFRVRALDVFGRVTFASGVSVRDDSTAAPEVRLWAKIDLDEPDSREVMGFVRWESGLPAQKAAVFMQNSSHFRKYLRRVETDEQGFFRFADVPGDEPYFVFALPPGVDDAIRHFQHFGVGSAQREVWQALELHPHRVTGDLPGAVIPPRRASEGPIPARRASEGSTLQLIRIDRDAERVIWSFHTDPSGRFTIANVPHGRYRIQTSAGDGGKAARSLPLEVTDGRLEVVVQWPKSSP